MMRYKDNRIVRIGDTVCVQHARIGTVVCHIENDEYSLGYDRGSYMHLETGIIIEFLNQEILYLEEMSEDCVLIRRDPNFLADQLKDIEE